MNVKDVVLMHCPLAAKTARPVCSPLCAQPILRASVCAVDVPNAVLQYHRSFCIETAQRPSPCPFTKPRTNRTHLLPGALLLGELRRHGRRIGQRGLRSFPSRIRLGSGVQNGVRVRHCLAAGRRLGRRALGAGPASEEMQQSVKFNRICKPSRTVSASTAWQAAAASAAALSKLALLFEQLVKCLRRQFAAA